jgi:Co/Zn/Cd efflux system component
MKKKSITITAILLVISLANIFRLLNNSTIRSVELLSIFVAGFLAGLLVFQLFSNKKESEV